MIVTQKEHKYFNIAYFIEFPEKLTTLREILIISITL